MSGTKEYRPWTPEQAFLLPPSPMDWLPEGHLAYFVLELVRELDLSAVEDAIQSKDPRGVRPYSPRMRTALLLYAYSTGVFSSRKIERATYQDVAFRVLAGGEHPDFTTVNAFRLAHREALSGLFVQVLRLCARAGLKTVGHVSLDGSKVQANAEQAQGHELRTDEGGREASGSRMRGAAVSRATDRRARGRAIRTRRARGGLARRISAARRPTAPHSRGEGSPREGSRRGSCSSLARIGRRATAESRDGARPERAQASEHPGDAVRTAGRRALAQAGRRRYRRG